MNTMSTFGDEDIYVAHIFVGIIYIAFKRREFLCKLHAW